MSVDIKRPVVLTDAGNAELFAFEHGADLRWVPEWGQWARYDGKRWMKCATEEIMSLAIQTARGFYLRAHEEQDDEKRKAYVAHAKAMESAGRLEAMVRLARTYMITRAADFDRDPYIVNVINGTLCVRAGVDNFWPHRRGDMLTKIAPIAWDPHAKAPTWDGFLARVLPDPALRAWVQKFVGYCLTGDVTEQVLAFFYGAGANGKSTILESLMFVIGGYAKAGAPDLLIAKQGEAHPTEVADLEGARLVTCQETEAGRQWAETVIKRLTGGDKIKARYMRCDFFEFSPTFKLIVSANHKPKVRGQDEGIWRRIRLVPFEVTIPLAERDPQLLEKLRAEASGVLRWCIEGCLVWQRDRLGTVPAITSATDAYRADQDHIGQFIGDCCERSPEAFVTTGELYQLYSTWCQGNGSKAWVRETFRDGLVERGFTEKRTKHARGITGLKIVRA